MAFFKDTFGFKEIVDGTLQGYKQTKAHFTYDSKTTVLTSNSNHRTWKLGPFSTPTLAELTQLLKQALSSNSETEGKHQQQQETPQNKQSRSGLTFAQIQADVRDLLEDPENAGQVFQVASQFNLLEMSDPSVTPLQGITRYQYDRTQGPACALKAPAATVFRHYFCGDNQAGQGVKQLDMLSQATSLLKQYDDAESSGYWRLQNGYLFPRTAQSLGQLNALFEEHQTLRAQLTQKVQVGVHWNTPVERAPVYTQVQGGQWREVPSVTQHTVTQVFCSGCPLSYSPFQRRDEVAWAPLATAVLNACFELTILVAALKAVRQKTRVKVFLTGIGAGVFGNPLAWVERAIEACFEKWREQKLPVDVIFVNYDAVHPTNFTTLSKQYAPIV